MLTEDAALINYLDKILKQINGGLELIVGKNVAPFTYRVT